jgi:CBS domain-containing protein
LLKLHGMLVLTVHPDFTLAEAARRFASSVGGRRFSLAVVTNHDDQVVGVISLATSATRSASTRGTRRRCWSGT